MGSSNPCLNKIITKIFEQATDYKFDIKCPWVSTSIQPADLPSRKIDFREEFIPQSIFEIILEFIGINPTVDGFATEANAKCDKYITLDVFDDGCFACHFK